MGDLAHWQPIMDLSWSLFTYLLLIPLALAANSFPISKHAIERAQSSDKPSLGSIRSGDGQVETPKKKFIEDHCTTPLVLSMSTRRRTN